MYGKLCIRALKSGVSKAEQGRGYNYLSLRPDKQRQVWCSDVCAKRTWASNAQRQWGLGLTLLNFLKSGQGKLAWRSAESLCVTTAKPCWKARLTWKKVQ